MFVLFMIYFTSKKRARVEPGRLAVPVAFRIGGFDLSFVETFDGRDRHVLSSLLVFLREFNRGIQPYLQVRQLGLRIKV